MLALLFMLFFGKKALVRILAPISKYDKGSHPFQLFQYTRVKILVQIAVLQRIMRGFLRRGDRGIQMLQLQSEAHPNLERIDHHDVGYPFKMKGADIRRRSLGVLEVK